MSESKFCDEFLSVAPKGHYSQIESHATSIGFPDIDYCVDGVNGHIELKFGDATKNKKPHMRPSQIMWFRNRIQAGGHPLIFAKLIVPGGIVQYLMYSGLMALELCDARKVSDWEMVAYNNPSHTKTWMSEIDEEELKHILLNPEMLC